MLNPRLAGRYAKSLIDLSMERNQLDAVYQDMLYIQSLQKQSPEFVSVIRSPVVPSDKKEKILEAVTGGNISEITSTFNKLLVRKGRESFLVEIVEAFIQQYKDHEGIHTVTLTTAVPVSDAVKTAIIDQVRTVAGLQQVELISKVDAALIGGFVLEVGDRLVDASVAYDLASIGKQFENNDFVYKIAEY
jgi:F-type H+-transporting ATPase subunit delta